mmetsp:Transcript_43198/g.109538  ORF Transcript_43198/g.109538 Transcript_43198/m.109538 type:complete len:275 (+) Transcript_43198:331-1155(+)
MRQASLRGDAQLAAEGGHVRNAAHELLDEHVVRDVQDSSGEDGAILEDLLDLHAVLERPDAQLREQHGRTRRDPLALLQDGELRDKFDLTLDDLRTDVQGLEESGLGRVHASRARGEAQVGLGHLAALGGGVANMLDQDLADVIQPAISGEDEADVAADVPTESVHARIWVHHMAHVERLADHGVLAHQHHGLATKFHADVLHLRGGHEVSADDERIGGVHAEVDELVEVLLLLSELLGARHSCEEKRAVRARPRLCSSGERSGSEFRGLRLEP